MDVKVNTHFEHDKKKYEHACYLSIRKFIHEESGWHAFASGVMSIFFGLATLAFVATAIFSALIFSLHLSGLIPFLLGSMGAMVFFGALGVFTLSKLSTLRLQLAGKLFCGQSYCHPLPSQQMQQNKSHGYMQIPKQMQTQQRHYSNQQNQLIQFGDSN